jgi:hypothetical protein
MPQEVQKMQATSSPEKTKKNNTLLSLQCSYSKAAPTKSNAAVTVTCLSRSKKNYNMCFQCNKL